MAAAGPRGRAAAGRGQGAQRSSATCPPLRDGRTPIPERLAQILQNLVRNAVTYTEAGLGRRRGACECDEAPHLRPRHGRRHRSEGRRRPVCALSTGEGATGDWRAGLGLAVVKALVEAHGGTVGVRSEGRGAGSEFSVSIPLSPSVSVTTAEARASQLPSHRILVVDDQHGRRRTPSRPSSKSWGRTSRWPYSAEEGLAKARRQEAAGGVRGPLDARNERLELARQLRKEFSGRAPDAGRDDRARRRLRGGPDGAFDHTLLKPITTEKLIEVLGALSPDGGKDS